MSSLPQPPPGQRMLGTRYVLQRKLGEGGLGVVWLAHDHVGGRTVAIKELNPLGSESQQEIVHERIRREALAVGRLAGHPHIVPIHEVLWEHGRPWIVMDYVEGESLQQIIAREGRISPRRAARIGLEVLDALGAAHDAGILHRDVKPSNVLIDESGLTRLTDFGIASLQGADSLTVTGYVIGSPGYIAPERLSGEFEESAASDLWSLGATLYAAVEGHMPYQDDDLGAMLAMVTMGPLPSAPHAGELLPVLTGLLERIPADRMSADEAARALTEVAGDAAGERPEIDGVEIGPPIGPSVWRARDGSGHVRAVKVLPPSSPVIEVARALVTGPIHGVVRLHAVGETRDGRAYVLMDYADRGSLARRTGGDVAELLRLAADVAHRVAEVNAAGGHYAELPPERILFTSAGEAAGRGEEMLLPVPDSLSGDAPPGADLAAVRALARSLLGERPYDLSEPTRAVIGRDDWPDVRAFAEALGVRNAREPAGITIPSSPGDTAAGPFEPPAWPGSRAGAPPGYGPQQPASPGYDPQQPAPSGSATQDVPWLPPPVLPPRRSAKRRLVPDWLSVRAPGPARHRPQPAPPPIWSTPPHAWAPHGAQALHSPLRAEFRYVHEPLRPGDEALPLLGNEPLIKALKERLVNSMGGTFLVTGFRGVGKSTVVEQAVAEITEKHPRDRSVLSVVLSVARPLETERLLFAIVRRVFEELVDRKFLDDLPADTRHQVMLAYMRTSLSFKQTRADTMERTSSVEFTPARIAGPAGMAIPKAGMSTKRSRSLATEAAFLAYSETDVEHDTMRIIKKLASVPRTPRGPWWRRRGPLDLQLVVVLDEVDKLTALQDGLDRVEKLLSGIKNVVTMRGAHYVVVAGPDLHDRVLRDSGRGNGIYESIFAWQMYVPCNWSAPRRLLDHLCLPEVAGSRLVEEFEKYLRFKSRGVLRKLLQELNAFVVWDEPGRPFLRIESRYEDAISFYASLEDSLDRFFAATRRQVPQTPIGRDRWRLGAYYVMDWILRSVGRPFTSADVIKESEGFDPLLRVSQTCAELLLDHLAEEGVLLLVREPARATSTSIPDVPEAQRPSYKLEDSHVDRLFGILAHDQYSDAEIGAGAGISTGTGSWARPGRTVPIETLANDRYELWRLIGEGGTSSVYEGLDTLLRRPVAVKMLRTALRTDSRARSRFLREATIAGALSHRNIVDVYEVLTLPSADDEPDGGSLAIVMELISGLTLDQLIERSGGLPAREVARLGITLADALGYLDGEGLARLDLKPQNIVMSGDRGPVIIDLGIAKIVENSRARRIPAEESPQLEDPATQTGLVVGTPAYLSPEQARGEDIDIRSDIYALGLVLCTCLAGRHPYADLESVRVMARAIRGGLDTSLLPCSPELREVLARTTAPERSKRYASPADLSDALRSTPEGVALARSVTTLDGA